MTAVETHWDIVIETDVPGQLTVRCGCEWFEVIPGADAPAIRKARRQWDEHDCGGRAFQMLVDAFPGVVLVTEDEIPR